MAGVEVVARRALRFCESDANVKKKTTYSAPVGQPRSINTPNKHQVMLVLDWIGSWSDRTGFFYHN